MTASTYSFSYLEPVCCSMSSSNCCFLTCIQISQEAGKKCHLVMSDSLQPYGLQPAKPTRLFHPWDFPSKNIEVGCHFLLQGIFPTQESNPGLPHCRRSLYHLSYQGSHRPARWSAISISLKNFRQFFCDPQSQRLWCSQ